MKYSASLNGWVGSISGGVMHVYILGNGVITLTERRGQ